MAAPTKNIPDVRTVILAALRAGATKKDAAHCGGIAYETLRVMCNEDPAFSAAVNQAQAQMRLANLKRIQKAAPTTWQAAAWLCERTDPEGYGRTVQDQRHGNIDDRPLQITHIEVAPVLHDSTTLRDDA